MAKDEAHTHDQQVSVNLDTTPILYTDNVSMTTNEDGLVLDFMQRVGSTNQFKVVSRIGMSRNHAKKYVEQLGKILILTEGTNQTGVKN